jgi:hypothetical protein
MPNIHLYGFTPEGAEEMKEVVDAAIQSIGLTAEAVTSIHSVKVESCNLERTLSPYLHVCSTDIDEVRKIVSALKTAKVYVDVEFSVIDGFVPAQAMQ